jgi:hypothetical protein
MAFEATDIATPQRRTCIRSSSSMERDHAPGHHRCPPRCVIVGKPSVALSSARDGFRRGGARIGGQVSASPSSTRRGGRPTPCGPNVGLPLTLACTPFLTGPGRSAAKVLPLLSQLAVIVNLAVAKPTGFIAGLYLRARPSTGGLAVKAAEHGAQATPQRMRLTKLSARNPPNLHKYATS